MHDGGVYVPDRSRQRVCCTESDHNRRERQKGGGGSGQMDH